MLGWLVHSNIVCVWFYCGLLFRRQAPVANHVRKVVFAASDLLSATGGVNTVVVEALDGADSATEVFRYPSSK